MKEGCMMLSFWLLVLSSVLAEVNCNKYSQNVNIPPPPLQHKRDFKMNKINMLWEKARKFVSGPKLNELYADLKYQDELERNVKKMQGEGKDKDGIKAAEIQDKFLDIIKRYGLDNREQQTVPGNPDDKTEFEDPKLMRMWKNAQFAGFNEQELNELKEEFEHHQAKLIEFNALRDEMTSIHGDERVDKNDSKWEEFNVRNMELKRNHRDLRDSLEKIESKVAPRPGMRSDTQFQDERVHKLWAQAVKANMTEEELNSFKEELRHFEHRIQKYKYFVEQASNIQFDTKNIREDSPDKREHIVEKAQHFENQVKKHETDIQKRLDKIIAKHSEL